MQREWQSFCQLVLGCVCLCACCGLIPNPALANGVSAAVSLPPICCVSCLLEPPPPPPGICLANLRVGAASANFSASSFLLRLPPPFSPRALRLLIHSTSSLYIHTFILLLPYPAPRPAYPALPSLSFSSCRLCRPDCNIPLRSLVASCTCLETHTRSVVCNSTTSSRSPSLQPGCFRLPFGHLPHGGCGITSRPKTTLRQASAPCRSCLVG